MSLDLEGWHLMQNFWAGEPRVGEVGGEGGADEYLVRQQQTENAGTIVGSKKLKSGQSTRTVGGGKGGGRTAWKATPLHNDFGAVAELFACR